MTGIKPRPGVVEPSPVVTPSSRTLEVKRPTPRVSSDAFDDTTDARRQRLARSTADGFVPVPKEKPAAIAPPPPPPEPIEIISVSAVVEDLKKEAEKPLDGPTNKSVKAPEPEPTRLEIELALEIEATIEREGGGKVKVKVDGKTGNTTIDNPDGDPATRVIRRTTDDGIDVDVGVGNISSKEGTVYEVRISAPKGTDLSEIDPDDPSTWPPGTKVTKHTTQSDSWSAGLTVGNKVVSVGGQLERYDETGTTETVEKTADGKVRVTRGPTSATDDSGMVKASLLGLGVRGTRQEQTKTEEVQTAEFDLNTPQGQAAYEQYKKDGTLPTANGPGVSNVSTTTTVSTDLRDTDVFTLLGYDVAEIKDSARGTSRSVTTRPDGTSTQTDQARFGEAPADATLVVTTERDAAGNPVGDPKKEVRFTVEADNVEAVNQRIEALNHQDGGNRPYVSAGDSVTLPADEQTRALIARQPGSAEALNRLDRTGVNGKDAQWEARGANPELIAEARRLGFSDEQIDAIVNDGARMDPQTNAPQISSLVAGPTDELKKEQLALLKYLSELTGLPVEKLIGVVTGLKSATACRNAVERLDAGEPLDKVVPLAAGLLESARRNRKA
ncbi:MAG: hypothetical protein ACO1OB_23685 [Archangium sp.]